MWRGLALRFVLLSEGEWTNEGVPFVVLGFGQGGVEGGVLKVGSRLVLLIGGGGYVKWYG